MIKIIIFRGLSGGPKTRQKRQKTAKNSVFGAQNRPADGYLPGAGRSAKNPKNHDFLRIFDFIDQLRCALIQRCVTLNVLMLRIRAWHATFYSARVPLLSAASHRPPTGRFGVVPLDALQSINTPTVFIDRGSVLESTRIPAGHSYDPPCRLLTTRVAF